jgi:hypothetical protein
MTIDLKSFLNKDSFALAIEKKVLGGLTYFEAVLEFGEDCDKSPEELMPYFSTVMLEKVRKSANDMGICAIDNESLDEFC